MNPTRLFSFSERKTDRGSVRRITLLMWVVAVLVVVAALAVPAQHSALAQTTREVTVEVPATSINYETATANTTVTGVDFTDWVVVVDWKASSQRYGRSVRAGPGLSSTPDDTFTYDDSTTPGTVTASVPMDRLIPASSHTVTVKLYEVHSSGTWLRRATGSTTFTTDSGCTDAGDMAGNNRPGSTTRPAWFGLHYVTHVTETELSIVVSANRAYAPENSGRCLYYRYREFGGGTVGI